MYWCGGIAGDYILQAESNSLAGPWHSHDSSSPNSYDISLQPTNTSFFDGIHTCNPTVLKVNSTYYMYYTGSDTNADGPGAIGVAQSSDARNWTRMNNGLPIVGTSLKVNRGQVYGAGSQTVTYANGKFYMMYIDTTGTASLSNGAGEYLLRADDPLFTQNSEIFTANGFVPHTQSTITSYIFYNGINVDLEYVDAWQSFLILSHTDSNQTHVVLFDKNFKQVTDQVIPSTQWCDGPGLVTDAYRHAIMKNTTTVSLDFLRAVGTCSDPFTWNLGWRGADLMKTR